MKLQLSIKPEDRVLEIGSGGTPHERADVFLEKEFDEKEAQAQRGYAKKLKTNKPVVYYKGGRFPFEDNEFDYVICTHVLEHIPSDSLEYFVAELTRVAKKA
jgi:SAM-dependent methyltransferase